MWPFGPLGLNTRWARNRLRAIGLLNIGLKAGSQKSVASVHYKSMYRQTGVKDSNFLVNVRVETKPSSKNRCLQWRLKDKNWECTLAYEADVQGREEE